jgi:hypothetical protein
VAVGAGDVYDGATSFGFQVSPAGDVGHVNKRSAPAEGAEAIRRSVGSTALVAVVELRREPADDSA